MVIVHRPVQKVALFKGCQSNPNLLGILVLDAVLPMIRLATFTLEEAPLPVGIQSFTGSAEFGDVSHHVFIREFHAHAGYLGRVLINRDW